jgi:hypothetical protein
MIIKCIQHKILIFTLLLPILLNGQQSKCFETRPEGVPSGIKNKKSGFIIADVPSYLWHRGCGPTALGMIIGYYDLNGFNDLFSENTINQTNSINMSIASDEHYNNYSIPLDYYPNLFSDNSENGLGHQNNSIADFMKTSMSVYNNYWGWSWSSDIGNAFEEYINYINPNYITNTEYTFFSNNSWEKFKTEIDNNRPVIILVDSDGDNSTDHFVVGFGYDNINQEFACYDTWDNNIHWYSWQEMQNGVNWGVFGFNSFNIENTNTSVTDEAYIDKKMFIIDILGKKTNQTYNKPLIYFYDNQQYLKQIIIR